MPIKLIPNDQQEGVEFFISNLEKAYKSLLLKEMLEECDDPEEEPVRLIEVSSEMLTKIISFMEHDDIMPDIPKPLKSEKISEWGLPKFYADFAENLTNAEAIQLVKAANYMDVKSLLNLGCARIASKIKGKTPDEIRKEFNIKSEEKEELESGIKEDNANIEKVAT